MRRLVVLLLVVAGCGRETEPPPPAPVPVAAKAPEVVPAVKPAEKPADVVAFEKAMVDFSDDVRAIANYLDLHPELLPFRAHEESLKAKYAKLPDPPTEPHRQAKDAAKKVFGNVAAAALSIQFRDEWLMLKSKENADKSADGYKQLAVKLREQADGIKASLPK